MKNTALTQYLTRVALIALLAGSVCLGVQDKRDNLLGDSQSVHNKMGYYNMNPTCQFSCPNSSNQLSYSVCFESSISDLICCLRF